MCPPPEEGQQDNNFAPKLVIQYKVDDNGEGRPLSPETGWWNPTDISFEPKDRFGNAQSGVPTAVSAIISNKGFQDAIGVSVEFWWHAPTAIFGNPRKITERIARVNVPHEQSVIVECPAPWTPAVFGDGHACLIVQCDCVLDPIKDPLHAELDPHVGQRNLIVKGAGSPTTFPLQLLNPFTSREGFRLSVLNLLVRGNFARLDQGGDPDATLRVVANALPGGPGSDVERSIGLEVTDRSVTEDGVHLQAMEPLPAGEPGLLEAQAYLQSRGAGADSPPGRPLAQFELGPGEGQTAMLEIPPADMPPGTFQVIHLLQTARDCVLGGYTVVRRAGT